MIIFFLWLTVQNTKEKNVTERLENVTVWQINQFLCHPDGLGVYQTHTCLWITFNVTL